MAAVWPDVTVTDESLTQCVHDLRRALGAHGAGLLRTVPRRGYVLDIAGMPSPAAQVVPGSIGVFPFELEGPGAAQDQILFDGLTHDVIGRLARLRSFHIIGRGSCFALRHLSHQPQELGQRLNLAYAVTGRVVRRGDMFRLHVDLCDCGDGRLLWSEAHDLALSDLMRMADTLPDQLAMAVAHEVTMTDVQRAVTMTESIGMEAWRAFHLGLNLIFTPGRNHLPVALERFTQAAGVSPGFARAHAFQSFCHYNMAIERQASDRAEPINAATRTAVEALRHDPASPVAHWAYGRALWLRKDPAAALQEMRHALQLCPSFPQAHYMAGFIGAHQGDAAQALDDLTAAESLSPIDPLFASLQVAKATALARLGDSDAAIDCALQSTRMDDTFDNLQVHAALILAGLGAVDTARQIMATAPDGSETYRADGLFELIYDMADDMQVILRRGIQVLGLTAG